MLHPCSALFLLELQVDSAAMLTLWMEAVGCKCLVKCSYSSTNCIFCFSFLVCIQSLFETIVSVVDIIYTFKMFYYPFWMLICTYVVKVCFSDFILLFICLCMTEQCWRRTEDVENLFLTWKCGEFFQKETLYRNKVCLFSQKAVSRLCLCAGGGEKGPHKPWCVWFNLYFYPSYIIRSIYLFSSGETGGAMRRTKSWRSSAQRHALPMWTDSCDTLGNVWPHETKQLPLFAFYLLVSCAGAATASTASTLLWSQQYTHP